MTRRRFLALGAGLTAMPSVLWAQQNRPLVGFLSSRSLADSSQILAAFLKGLAEAGYRDGENVTVMYRWAEGDYGRLPALAADVVNLGPSVIVSAGGEPTALAAAAATTRIPIVFAVGGDPVKIGLVKSHNRPGGNATGISLLTTTPESKRLGLLHELVPSARLIGILIDRKYQESESQAREVSEAARLIGSAIAIDFVADPSDLQNALGRLKEKGVDAMLVCASPFFDTRRTQLVAFELEQRIPAMFQFREYVSDGGLMSYGISISDGYRQMGQYVSQILKGASASELPIVQSIKFEFIINLRAARMLGMQIPASLQARADEIVE